MTIIENDTAKLIRWLRGRAEAAVTAAGSRATFKSDMYFSAADAIEGLDAHVTLLGASMTSMQKQIDGLEALLVDSEAANARLTDLLNAAQMVRDAFGAPGDYGYETAQGRALYELYKSMAYARSTLGLPGESK
mgnify:CR=1 FL=1